MYNVELLHKQLEAAGLQILGVNSEGTIWYVNPPTSGELVIANQILAAHNPDQPLKYIVALSGITTLPNWSTWTPTEAEQYITTAVFSGQSDAEISAWIDTNVTTLAQAKTALKLLASNIITIRTILANIAKAVLFLRDILLRRL